MNHQSNGVRAAFRFLLHRPIQFLEPVFVHLPKDAKGRIGDEYLVYRLDSLIEGQGLVEETGAKTRGASGRPAKLFAFRREVLRERGVVGTKPSRAS